MVDPVMQRPMFQGGGAAMSAPMPMNAPAMPLQAMPPSADDVGIAAGLGEVGAGLEQMNQQIEGAEDYVGIMNALRGDNKSMEERRTELAGYVGKADATQTPESVLTLLQPTFNLIETAEQGSSQQEGMMGNDMPMSGGGITTVNFNEASSVQAPGTEEAMMRIASGEQPVRRNQGSTGAESAYNFNTIPMATVVKPNVPNLSVDLPYLSQSSGVNAPQLQTTNMGTAQNYAKDFMTLMNPALSQMTGGAGPSMDERLNMLNAYLPQKKTTEQILAEYDALGYGKASDDQAALQGYLALIQAGQKIASSPKNLLGASIDAAGEVAPTLSKIAQNKFEQEQKLKLSARAEAKQGEDAFRGAQLQIANAAIADSARAASNIESALVNANNTAISQGLKLAGEEAKVFNDSLVMQWNANNSFAQLPTETYGKVTTANGKSTVDLQNVYRTQDGLKIYKDGKFQPLPEGYIKYSKDAFAAKYPSATTNLDGAKRIDVLVPDTTGKSKSGYNQFAGFYKDGKFYYSPTGNPTEAIMAPRGFLVGKESEVLKVADPDSVGRVFVTIKSGARAGTTFLSSIQGTNIPGAAFELEPVVRDNTGKYVSGNPLVYMEKNPGISFANMTPQMVSSAQRKVINMSNAISEGSEVLSVIGDAVGPLNTIKSWTSNTIGAIGPEAWSGMTEYAKTERGRARMNNFARTLSAALILSDRYAVAEQELIRQMAEDPEGFWKNPDMSEVKFQEMMRVLQNELSLNRGILSDKPEIAKIRSMPTGSANDPIMFGAPGQFEMLQIQKQQQGADAFKGLTIRMTRSEATARGIQVPANQDYVDLIIGKDVNL